MVTEKLPSILGELHLGKKYRKSPTTSQMRHPSKAQNLYGSSKTALKKAVLQPADTGRMRSEQERLTDPALCGSKKPCAK